MHNSVFIRPETFHSDKSVIIPSFILLFIVEIYQVWKTLRIFNFVASERSCPSVDRQALRRPMSHSDRSSKQILILPCLLLKAIEDTFHTFHTFVRLLKIHHRWNENVLHPSFYSSLHLHNAFRITSNAKREPITSSGRTASRSLELIHLDIFGHVEELYAIDT